MLRPADDEVPPEETDMMMNTALRRSERVRVTVVKASAMTEAQTSRFEALRPADDEVPPEETDVMMNTALRRSEPRTRKRKARNTRMLTQSAPWIPDWGRIATRRIVEKGWKCKHTIAQITKRVMQELTFNENTRTNVTKYVTNIVIELNKEHHSVKSSVETESMQCANTGQSSGTQNSEIRCAESMADGDQRVDMDASPCKCPAPIKGQNPDTKNSETARMNKSLRYRILNILQASRHVNPRVDNS